jgi:hypothetical protein
LESVVLVGWVLTLTEDNCCFSRDIKIDFEDVPPGAATAIGDWLSFRTRKPYVQVKTGLLVPSDRDGIETHPGTLFETYFHGDPQLANQMANAFNYLARLAPHNPEDNLFNSPP